MLIILTEPFTSADGTRAMASAFSATTFTAKPIADAIGAASPFAAEVFSVQFFL